MHNSIEETIPIINIKKSNLNIAMYNLNRGNQDISQQYRATTHHGKFDAHKRLFKDIFPLVNVYMMFVM